LLLYYITDRRQLAPSGTEKDECRRRERLLEIIEAAASSGVDYIQLRERDLPPRELEALAREAVQIVRRANRRSPAHATRLLVNSRLDVALAAGADGVHLPGDGLFAADARAAWQAAACNHSSSDPRQCGEPRAHSTLGVGRPPSSRAGIFAVSCHAPADVRMAEAQGADFAVFAPVFEKLLNSAAGSAERNGNADAHQPNQNRSTRERLTGAGLEALRQACTGEGPPCNVEGIGASRLPVLALGGVTLQNALACIAAGAAGIAAIRLFQENDIAEVVARLRSLH
jgi:thiamine-phosphate pyrophosphorylase